MYYLDIHVASSPRRTAKAGKSVPICRYSGNNVPERYASQFGELWHEPGCAGVALKCDNFGCRVVRKLVTNW